MASSEADILPEVCAFYGLGALRNVKCAGGCANHNMVVHTGTGRFFVKFVIEHSLDDLTAEMRFLNRISAAGFWCPGYLQNQYGEQVFRCKGHVVVVLPYLKVEVKTVVSPDMLSQLGRALAKLHGIHSDFLQPRNTWWSSDYLDKSLRQAKQRTGGRTLAKLENRISALKNIARCTLPISIVHGDPWPGNALFDGPDLAALIDWEEVTLGASIFDLAWLSVNACFPDGEFDPALFQALVQSYQSVRILTFHERHCFNQIVHRVVCTACLWRLLKSADKSEYPEHLELADWLFQRDLDRLKLDK